MILAFYLGWEYTYHSPSTLGPTGWYRRMVGIENTGNKEDCLTRRWSRPLKSAAAQRQNVHPTAGGRVNGVADEPRWLRPPAVAEPADGTDGPAGPGSSATPLGRMEDTDAEV
jgi:hypothetical protein